MYFEYLPVLYNKARGSVWEKQTKKMAYLTKHVRTNNRSATQKDLWGLVAFFCAVHWLTTEMCNLFGFYLFFCTFKLVYVQKSNVLTSEI